MKKGFIILLLFLTAAAISSCSVIKGVLGGYSDHFSTAFCYRSLWSPWQQHRFYSSGTTYDQMRINSSNSKEGHIIGLSLCDSMDNTFFKFIITDYVKGKKYCTGTVEYYVNDKFPTAEDLAKSNVFVIPNYRDITPSVKRTTNAKINIVNEGRTPSVFNIWFDNIGVGIDVRNIYWH